MYIQLYICTCILQASHEDRTLLGKKYQHSRTAKCLLGIAYNFRMFPPVLHDNAVVSLLIAFTKL